MHITTPVRNYTYIFSLVLNKVAGLTEIEFLCKFSITELKVQLGINKVKSFSNSNGYFLANNSQYLSNILRAKLNH